MPSVPSSECFGRKAPIKNFILTLVFFILSSIDLRSQSSNTEIEVLVLLS